MSASRLESFVTVPAATTVSATNVGGGPTSVTITAGRYTLTLLLVHVIAQLNAQRTGGTWSGSISYASGGTGLVTLNCTGGAWALSFTTAELGTLLGFVGNIGSGVVPVTGTQNMRGLWMPDCPLMPSSDPIAAPEVTDTRTVETPTGDTVSLGGSCKYVHTGLRWTHVTRSRVMAGAETTTYASLQSWLRDTQWGRGHSWFSVGEKFQPYWDNQGTAAIMASDLNAGAGATYGWSLAPAVTGLDQVVRRVDEKLLGMLGVEFQRITSQG